MMVELSVYEVKLVREALKSAAARHQTTARFVAKRKTVPTAAELHHETTAEAMLSLRERSPNADEIAAATPRRDRGRRLAMAWPSK